MLKQLRKYDVMTSYLDHLAENDTALQEGNTAPLCESTEKERAIETEVIDSFPKKVLACLKNKRIFLTIAISIERKGK